MENKEEYINTEIAKFDVTEATLSEMEMKYSGMIIFDIDDKDGYKKVKDAKKIVSKLRIAVENKRKDLKKNLLTLSSAIETEANRIKDRLISIETDLKSEMKKIDDEKEEIANREQRIKEDTAQSRIDESAKYNVVLRYEMAMHYSDEEYSEYISNVKTEYEAEQAKEAQDKADREAEKTRIKDEQKKLDDEKAEFEASKEKLRIDNEAKEKAAQKIIDDTAKVIRLEKEEFEAEKKAFQDEQDKIAQDKIDAQKKIDDAQKKIDDEKERAIDIEQAKKERTRLGGIEVRRQEVLSPDKKIILAFGISLLNFELPEVTDSKSKLILLGAQEQLKKINNYLIEKCKDL